MGNGKTSVLALFPASEQKIPIIYKKNRAFLHAVVQTKKLYTSPNPNPKTKPKL